MLCSGSVCGTTPVPLSGKHELFDDTKTCDAAGTVFHETLEDLNEVDRLLLVFSSSSNLAAVRWLIALGANLHTCDTNGTMCLHAACRSGSLAIVRELISRGLPLTATDAAGWTPLHVAIFMGRRSVAVDLMEHGADLTQRNKRGFTAAELCNDVWLCEAVNACAAHRRCHGASTPWRFSRASEIREDIRVSSHLRFEPYFVPRLPVLKDFPSSAALRSLGIEIFNQRPGQGLAFLVATNCVRDFPVELSGLLSGAAVNLAQVGEFLGEDFALSQTLRLEHINSARLTNTGVVSCLAKVFSKLHIPHDMRKIDRLIDGIAQIWWRQHEKLAEKAHTGPSQGPLDDVNHDDDRREVEGLQLMRHLSGYDELHQLMFSAILLHWNLYTPLPQSQRVTADQWLLMNTDLLNTGVGASDNDASGRSMKRILQRIYNVVKHTCFDQLKTWGAPTRVPPPICETAATDADKEWDMAAEGWAVLCDGGFPSLATSGTTTYWHLRSIFSETTSSQFPLASPETSRCSRPCAEPCAPLLLHGDVMPASVTYRYPELVGASIAKAATSGGIGGACNGRHRPPRDEKPGGRENVWLTLRKTLLFLASRPHNWAPYAFMHIDSVVYSINSEACTLTLSRSRPRAAPCGADGALSAGGGAAPGGGGAAAALGPDAAVQPQVQLMFLLPDGRWQVLELPHLKVQLPDLRHLDQWRRSLAVHCSSVTGTGTARTM